MHKEHIRLILLILLGLAIGIFITSCMPNSYAKKYGGTIQIDLPIGAKLENATWKEDQIWYLTRPRTNGEQATTHEFKEESNYGLVEGKVVFVEH